MGVSGVAALEHRQMKRRATAETASPCFIPVASMEVDSPPDTVLMGVEKQSSCPSIQKILVRGVSWDNPRSVVELHVPEAKLGCASVGSCFGVFTGPQTEEQANLYQVCRTLGLG